MSAEPPVSLPPSPSSISPVSMSPVPMSPVPMQVSPSQVSPSPVSPSPVSPSPVRALVVSDTHVRAGGSRRLPTAVLDAAAQADVILHAGDVVSRVVLDELGARAPVRAVLGNNDHELVDVLPGFAVVELGGVSVAMIHDSGPSLGRARRLRRMFPEAAVVVFGHSHLPLAEVGVDGQLLFNPGSPTERRRAPTCTYGWLELADGRVCSHAIIDV